MVNSPSHCYTIPPQSSFAGELSRWVLSEYSENLAKLPQLLLLMPNRRACRSLKESFLKNSDGKPLMLPRIQPIGELGEDDMAAFANIEALYDIPPAISPVRRHLLLANLIGRFEQKRAGQHYSHEQALALARQLASFMDDVSREGLSFDLLAKLAPEEMQIHWQQTIDFLSILFEAWPEILKAEGLIDPVARRTMVLQAISGQWKKNPPSYPVVAAGSTGSQAATAALLSTISRMASGKVILPGLDLKIPDKEWDLIEQTHPQYGLRKLLEIMKCKRGDVKILTGSLEKEPPRITSIRNIFQPPAMTAYWPQTSIPDNGLDNIRIVTAETQLDEARMIGIILREVLSTPEKTAALVTPDRNLARMVSMQMQRYGITIDDSAGISVLDSPPAVFMRLVIELAQTRAAPVQLLALLRHPLAAIGLEPAQCRTLSRLLEKEQLRGIRMSSGLEALYHGASIKGLKELLAKLMECCQRFSRIYQQPNVSLKLLLEAHIECAEALAATNEEAGENRLWSGEAGNVLAKAIANLLEHADILESISPRNYASIFQTLLADNIVRPAYGKHPRLAILSPMEARLQSYDMVILGELNEGVWPSQPEPSPWMSRPMQQKFGLPSDGRAIGQSAHDVWMLASSSELIIARSRKIDDSPAVISRWLMRMQTWIEGVDKKAWESMQCESQYKYGISQIDKAVSIAAINAPAPCPPLAARPQKLSVTEIDTLVRDPYMIYARRILRLNELDPLDQDPQAAELGSLVHSGLEQFIQLYPKDLPDNSYDALLECGKTAFAEFMDRPAVARLWWPRFEVVARWFLLQEEQRRKNIKNVHAEINALWKIDGASKDFSLSARIDRIEEYKDGSLHVIDYKTGVLPSQRDVDAGLSNQLPLCALALHSGEHELDVNSALEKVSLEYWKLSASYDKCEIRKISANMDEVSQRLKALISEFNNKEKPYAAQGDIRIAPRYNSYGHLTRREEWGAV